MQDGTVPRQRTAGYMTAQEPLLLGRQSLYTRDGDRFGCELLYRSAVRSIPVDRWSPAQQDRATRHVILAALRCGLPALSDERPVFVNATRSLLVGTLRVPHLPEQMGIEVVESVVGDAEVVAGVRELRAAGHLIAIDDFSAHPNQLPLLRDADLVKIDMRDLVHQGESLLELARSHGARTVIERVETAEQLSRCQELGFDLFQGNLLEPALVLDVRSTPVLLPRC